MAHFPQPERIATNGIELAVWQKKPAGKAHTLPIVFCHGFPELGYSWRHQLDAAAAAGFHAIAPDLRGYGRSDVPDDTTSYDMKTATADVAGLVKALGYDTAIFVGHDFGGMLVWALPFYQPDMIAGIASICTPFTPRAKNEPISMFNHIYGENNYINRFQEPGFMEARFDPDPGKLFRMMMRVDEGQGTPLGQAGHLDTSMMEWWAKIETDEATWPGRVFLDEDELQFYVDAYNAAGGFKGGFNWYRCLSRTWEDMAQFYPEGVRIKLDFPTLQMMPDADPSSPPMLADGMPKFCTDYDYKLITGAGHWAQQEQPAQVNAALTDWLERKFS